MPEADLGAVWIVGGGGLLGGAAVSALVRQGRDVHRVKVPWQQPDRAIEVLAEAAGEIGRSTAPWRVLWCAGAAVTGADTATLHRERQMLQAFLDALPVTTPGRSARGAVFLASSAGGVFAGSDDPPFSESTAPRPISAYGESKLLAESIARSFAERTGTPVVIGRISNLYGPGQDVTKAQGLITQLFLAHLNRRPLSIYVSLDTSRDYLFVDDAAAMAIGAVDRVARERPGTTVVKIMASHRPTVLAAILGEMRRITRHRPSVTLGQSPMASFQTRDLRFRSDVWTDLDDLASTPLPVGMAATLNGLRAAISRGGIHPT